MKIIGFVFILISAILFFLKRSQTNKAFSVKSANSATVKELETTSHAITQEIGQGNWRDYVKIWGKIITDQPLISELKQETCVYYKMTVHREYEETINKQNNEGKWVQETNRGSELITSNERKIPFIIRDNTGEILVNPDESQIETINILNEFRPGEIRGNLLSFGGFSLVIGNNFGSRRTLGYRYRESILPVNYDVLIVGEVSDETGKLTLRKPLTKSQEFIISLKTEEVLLHNIKQAEKNLLFSTIVTGVIGLILIIIS